MKQKTKRRQQKPALIIKTLESLGFDVTNVTQHPTLLAFNYRLDGASNRIVTVYNSGTVVCVRCNGLDAAKIKRAIANEQARRIAIGIKTILPVSRKRMGSQTVRWMPEPDASADQPQSESDYPF